MLSLYDCTVMTTVRQGERQKRCRLSSEFWITAATPTQLLEQRTKTSKKYLYGSIRKLKGILQGKGQHLKSGKLVYMGRTETPIEHGKSNVNRKYRAKKRTRVPHTKLQLIIKRYLNNTLEAGSQLGRQWSSSWQRHKTGTQRG